VGLPEGQMGIAKWTHESWCRTHRLSDLAKINLAVANKTLAEEQVLKMPFNMLWTISTF
jgi:2,3-bisphosphoglycerate-independent phosphoglycerate mutase